jgi:hypothetical protein
MLGVSVGAPFLGEMDSNTNYLDQPSGQGVLVICRSAANGFAPLSLSTGESFVDIDAPEPPDLADGPPSSTLRVDITTPAEFRQGQECATAHAKIIVTIAPANYADMKPVTNFSVSEGRRFRLAFLTQRAEPNPDLASLRARALTDFK